MFSRSVRSLASRPILSAVAIATLAVGLGANAAIFSLTREVLLRPLPYRDADRLVWVFERSPSTGVESMGITPVNYVGWRDRVDAFEQTSRFLRVSFNVSRKTSAVQVEGFKVAAGFLPMLGVQPALGRGFTEDDAQPGRDTVVILTDGFWRRYFSADPDIVGQSVDVDGTACTIVGVLGPNFTIFHDLNREVELFRPHVLTPTDREQSIGLYAKLRPNVSIDAARAQLAAAYAGLPIPNHLWTAGLRPLSTTFAANARPTLIAAELAVALVLLIACANIANLRLAVSASRRKELAVRHALGATRWRIARDLAGETIVLTIAGAAGATLLATWTVAVLNSTVSFLDVNRLHPFQVDGWVLAFTIGLALIVTLFFGVLPARAAARIDVVDALKDLTHGVTVGISNRHLRHALIIGELALSIVLTASALALTRSAVALQVLPRGLAIDGVMTAQVTLNDPRYLDTGRLVHTTSSMLDRLAAAPAVADAALVNYPPLALIRVGVPVSLEGHPPPTDLPLGARYCVATLVARTRGGPAEAAAPAIREAARGADAQAPVSYEMSLDAVIGETFARPRVMAWLVGTFAVLALGLSAIGVYGVMTYLATARAREIGIRIALGATLGDIVWLIVGHAIALTGAAAALGILLAPMALRLLEIGRASCRERVEGAW